MFSAIIDRCNAFAQSWASWVGMSIIDAAIVLAIVSLVWWAIRRKAPPQLGYLLFLLVPLKLFILLYVSIPDRFFSWAPRMAASSIGNDATAIAPPFAVLPGEKNMMFPRERSFDLPARAEFKSAGDDRGALPKGHLQQPAPLNVARRAALSLFAWLMFAWVLGIFALLARLALAQIRFHRGILRDAKTVNPIELPIDFAGLLNRMLIGRQIRIVESDRLSSPVVWGMFRPVLILPAGFAESMSSKRLEWVLLHELAHVKRRDLIVNCLQRAAGILHFINPSIWIANRAINRLREYACDDMASAYGNVSAGGIGRGLFERHALRRGARALWRHASRRRAGHVRTLRAGFVLQSHEATPGYQSAVKRENPLGIAVPALADRGVGAASNARRGTARGREERKSSRHFGELSQIVGGNRRNGSGSKSRPTICINSARRRGKARAAGDGRVPHRRQAYRGAGPAR